MSCLERELKLAVPAGFRVPDLDGLDPGLSVSPEELLSHTAVYYDTADLRLARWDCGLRHRSSDGWTLKLGDQGAGPAIERREFRFAGSPAHPPVAALDLVQVFTRERPLEPVARLRTERRRTRLRDRGGQTLVEVTDDTVTVLDGRVPGLRFREIEVELAESCPGRCVEELLLRLRRAGAGSSHKVAKHARALGLEAGVPPEVPIPEVDADSATVEVLRLALSEPVAQLVRCDPGVRADEDVEDVHKMRVATRRLRSHLRTFRPLLDEAWAEALQAGLRELGTALGGVRDADVLGAWLARVADVGSEPERRAAKELSEYLRERRELDRARLLAWLRSERHRELVERLIAAAREPRLGCDGGAPAVETLPPLVWRRWKRLRRAVSRLGDPPRDEDVHRVRIAAKHARYSAEAVAPVFGRPVRRLARSLRPLQEALGDHHDAVVAGAWLRDSAARVSSEAAFAAGLLAAREQAAAGEALASWERAWKRARRRARRSAKALRLRARETRR